MTEPRHRILIVDDDETLRAVFRRLLQRNGFDAVAADGAASAVKALMEQPFDLVMLDNHMPETNGIELISRIREHRPKKELPILLISGSSHLAEIEEAMSNGANAFLRKPVGAEELISKARRLLEGPQAETVPHSSQPHRGERS